MNQEGLIHAFIFDGAGGARQIGWNEIRSWSPEEGPIWIHLDFTSDYARKWVQEESSIDEIASEALLSEETRPRTTVIGDFALLSLRGVNLSPGSDPEDMVSIRIWLDQHRIISTRRRTLLSVADMVSSFKAKSGPKTTGEFLVNLTGRLTARMEGVVEGLEDRANQMEEDVLISGSHLLRSQLSEIRRETIMLRRYFAPQREAMIRLYTEKIEWLDEISPSVDHICFVEDSQWGGKLPDSNQLSPNSQAMVRCSDIFFGFGGGLISRDEMLAAQDQGKPVYFYPAERNHDYMIRRAKKRNLDPPESFWGEAHEVFSDQ